MEKKIKISATAYRVLLLLLHLNDGQGKVDNLNMIFSTDKYTSRYFSKEVILKYISTLRTANYDISKPTAANNYNYELNKSPVLIELSNEQIKNLAVMLYYAESLHQNKIIDNYNSFLKKIKKFIPVNQVQLLNKEIKKQGENLETGFFKHAPYGELIKKIEKYLMEKQRVSVKYKRHGDCEKEQVVLELKNIKYDEQEIYIAGYNPINEQALSIKFSQIIEIKQLPTKSQYNQMLSPVTFELKGQLAKIYRLYEDEKITSVNEKSSTITVTAYVDDKEMLIKRLLKYGENCEVVYPKHAQNDMIKIINQTLKNYE